MTTRNDQKARKLVRLLAEACDLLARIQVLDRGANEADKLRQQLDLTLCLADDFAQANAEYTEDELAEDAP